MTESAATKQILQNIKPKHTVRALKKYAKENCEPKEYSYLEKFYRPIFDDESNVWRSGTIGMGNVNHGRRVKKVFKKWGINAAIAYLTVNKKKETTNIQTINQKNEESIN